MLPKDNTDISCAQMQGGLYSTTNVLTQQLTIRDPLVVLESRQSWGMSSRLRRPGSFRRRAITGVIMLYLSYQFYVFNRHNTIIDIVYY